jgi:beta-mannosidase
MTRIFSLNGTWNYTPTAHVLLKPGGVMIDDTTDLPPGGTMELPMNWEKRGLHDFKGRVRFERNFEFGGYAPGEQGARLVFRGVDYFAAVWLNGVKLGEHEGYFQPFEFGVSAALNVGQNQLIVEVACPFEEPRTVWPDRKYMAKGTINHWDCRPGSWDFEHGQDMNSGGIWHDVYLETLSAAHIGGVKTSTRLIPVPQEALDPASLDRFAMHLASDARLPKHACVTVESEVEGTAGEYRLQVQIGDEPAVEKSITHYGAAQSYSLTIWIANPKLWWTWDRGEPHLETCVIRLLDGDQVLYERRLEIGLRTIEIHPETGEWWLNGERVFIRGSNFMPTLWLGEYDQALIDQDIQFVLGANMNAVRMCVHINRDELYTALDRAGIMVLQEFPLLWGYEPNLAYYDKLASQVRDMVRLLYNHPCVAFWMLHCEPPYHNRYIGDPILLQACRAEDPTRYARQTSEFHEHAYRGWYGGHYRDYTSLPGAPLLTEMGLQALPDVDLLHDMFGDTWPPDWDAMAYHDFQYDQTFHVAGIEMGRNWEEFSANSQNHQAKVLKFAIEQYRQHKYSRIGCMFHFLFNDCWDAITWSTITYRRVPKKGYFSLQEGYQPILIGTNLTREKYLLKTDRGSHVRDLDLTLWVVNDYARVFPGCTSEIVVTGPGGEFSFVDERPFDVPADGVTHDVPRPTVELPTDLPPGVYTLILRLFRDSTVLSTNTYALEIVGIPG